MRTKTLTPLVAALSLALGSTAAFAIDEMEPNDSASAAQAVNAAWGSIRVNGMMGAPGQTQHNDLDFYKVNVKAGEVLTIDIDNGYSADAPLNTIVAVFGPGPDFKMLRVSDMATVDEGSTSVFDARIEDFVAPESGTYTVGVSTVPRYFSSGGMTFADLFGFGLGGETIVKDYTLEIASVSAADSVKKINIEVKPGSDEVAPLNPRSRGKVPVAILGSDDFSVMTVDTKTLTFGATGDESSLHKCAKSAEDVNMDGHYDLVCHFNNQAADFNADSLEGVLKGETEGGEQFEGRAQLKVIPAVK